MSISCKNFCDFWFTHTAQMHQPTGDDEFVIRFVVAFRHDVGIIIEITHSEKKKSKKIK